MTDFYIKINRRESIKIEKDIFESLFDQSPIRAYKACQLALTSNEIKLADLKDLAKKADVPYPLFFAPKKIVNDQIKDKNKNIFDKIPSKPEMQLAFRGATGIEGIEIIIKDIGRKQEFLKDRVLTGLTDNKYIGSLGKAFKTGTSNKELAKLFREYFEIDLKELRKLSKEDVVRYICAKAEEKNIFVSLSSYNYMPQNLDRDLGLSGLCVKDKKIPYVFINTRDGDETPKILETAGRQIFTLISMLVCIGINKFVLSTKTNKTKDNNYTRVYSIASEILIPSESLDNVEIKSLDDLFSYSKVFKVTPSMFLVCLVKSKKMSQKVADQYLEALRKRVKGVTTPRNQPLPINAYRKYNGEKFSKEVVGAYKNKKISQDELKNVLFRKGNKMDNSLLQEYLAKF